MNLDELHKMRERAGISFKKSFNCKDAEKNIHLVDKDQFFKKILERLSKLGYTPLRDFEFEVVRYKFPYAERHHIGKTYEWKYFYSTTFEISDELIEYLTYHNFIQKKEEKKAKKDDYIKNIEPTLKTWEDVIKHNERKIKRYIKEEQEFRERGAIESADNTLRAIERCRTAIENVKNQIKGDKTN